jgi:glycosyltransferase involved in cell wall biosynthesis
MLRILELTGTLDASGAETVVVNLSNALSKNGHFVSVCSRIDGPLAQRLENVSCHLLPKRGTVDPSHLTSLVRLVRSLDVDIIHSHLFGTDIYGFLAARITGRAHVCTIHGLDSLRSRKRIMAYRALVPLSHHVVAVSEMLRDDFVTRCGVDPSKVSVVRNGIDVDVQMPRPETLRQLRALLEINNGHRVIGAVGNVKRVKAYEVLLRAFAKVRVAHPGTILLIAGTTHEDPDYTRELHHLAKNLGLQHAVKLIGSRTDVREILSLMDVYVLPSFSEGTSLALLEAMVAGRAIAATAVGGTPNVVTHGESALLMDAGNIDQLAEALCTLLGNRDLAKHLGAQARASVSERYGLAQMVRGYTRVFEEAVSGFGHSNQNN